MDLSDQEKEAVRSLLKEYDHSFAKDNSELSSTNVVEQEINDGNAKQIKERLRRLQYYSADAINEHVQ